MRIRRTIVALFASAAAALPLGCATVRHHPEPLRLTGTTVPVQVSVRAKADASVHGSVYYRFGRAGAFESTSMQRRGNELVAMLPTENLGPDECVQYYVDVEHNGELHALGSPASPFVVTFLDRTNMVLSQIRDRPLATDDMHEVRIVLLADGQIADQPWAIYQMPGVPGEVRTGMESDGYGNYHVVIPPGVVIQGTWRYAIEVPIDGEVHRLPNSGFRSFEVKPAAAVVKAPERQQ